MVWEGPGEPSRGSEIRRRDRRRCISSHQDPRNAGGAGGRGPGRRFLAGAPADLTLAVAATGEERAICETLRGREHMRERTGSRRGGGVGRNLHHRGRERRRPQKGRSGGSSEDRSPLAMTPLWGTSWHVSSPRPLTQLQSQAVQGGDPGGRGRKTRWKGPVRHRD